MAIEPIRLPTGPYLEVTKLLLKRGTVCLVVGGMSDQQTNYLVQLALCFDNNTFQDGNGKLDYDEFLKMLLQY